MTDEEKRKKKLETQKRWREKNKDKIKSYYEANKEKICAQARQWAKDNPEAIKRHRESKSWGSEWYRTTGRNATLLRTYGITEEEYEARIVAQGSKCAICGEPLDNSKTTHLNHNHETGELRGFLCMNCNNGIGKFKDRIDLLEAAIVYLKSYEPHDK